jgi:hypothetical protein
MTCEEARAAMLSGADIEPVHQHLTVCRLCSSEQPMWAKLRSTLSIPSLWEEPPSDLVDRITSTVRGEHADIEPGRQRTVLFAGVAITMLIALAGTLFATRSLTADWEEELVNTAEAPNASVVVRGWSTARGTRMVLDIVGIEDAPSGSYYEIWLTAPDGRHISAGTFNGSGRVTAFAGVRRADYPRIWITLESANNVLGPSRETYFDTA